MVAINSSLFNDLMEQVQSNVPNQDMLAITGRNFISSIVKDVSFKKGLYGTRVYSNGKWVKCITSLDGKMFSINSVNQLKPFLK